MCNYFSAIITRKGEVLFCELDAHEEIIKRKGLKDDKLEDRDFVRIEITEGKYKVDEVDTLPDWYIKKGKTLKRKAFEIFKKVDKCHKQYNKVKAPALEQYNKVKAPALEQYNKVKAPAWEQYNKVKAPALEQYNKVEAQAWEQYNKVKAPAWEQYNKVKAQALEQYKIKISKIKGFVSMEVK